MYDRFNGVDDLDEILALAEARLVVVKAAASKQVPKLLHEVVLHRPVADPYGRQEEIGFLTRLIELCRREIDQKWENSVNMDRRLG